MIESVQLDIPEPSGLSIDIEQTEGVVYDSFTDRVCIVCDASSRLHIYEFSEN